MDKSHDVITLRARWVLPMDAPPIPAGTVRIQGSRILSVGRQDSTSQLIDLGDVAMLPGFVNPHTHLEFSRLQQPLGEPDQGFAQWLAAVIRWRRGTMVEDPEEASDRYQASLAAGLAESRAAGVTSLADIVTRDVEHRVSSNWPAVIIGFRELIGLRADRIEQQIAIARNALWTDGAPRNQTNTLPGYTGLSPHAPYSVHPRLLDWICQASCEQAVTVAMHVAESEQELELLAAGTGPLVEQLEQFDAWDPNLIGPGTEPTDLLRVLARAHRCLVIHGNYLKSTDWDFLAQRRKTMSVVFCPRTHHYFRHPAYPLAEMLQAGVRVAIGTDSRASNPDLSVLEELRFVADNHPGIRPHQILHAGTLAAAEALGIDPWIGSITAGKRADLSLVPCTAPTTRDPCEAILQSKLPVSLTICGGVLEPAIVDLRFQNGRRSQLL